MDLCLCAIVADARWYELVFRVCNGVAAVFAVDWVVVNWHHGLLYQVCEHLPASMQSLLPHGI